MKKTHYLAGILALAFLGSCSSDKNEIEKSQNAEKTVKVETIQAQLGTNQQTFNYSGLITPTSTTPLSFQLPGTITQIYVEQGDKVQKGQVLAELDKTTFINTYQAAKAMEVQARDAYNRLKTVYDKGSLPDIEWEDIKSKLAQAEAAEQIALNNLNKCTLKAPKAGYIGSRNTETGATSITGVSIFDLVDINEVYVRISVPENEINKIQKNQQASIVIPAIDQTARIGSVERVGVVANPLSKTYEVNIRIENKKLRIKPGMVCDVNLAIENTSTPVILPSQAVMQGAGNTHYVYLLNTTNTTARKQEVQVGQFHNNHLEILAGVNQGDMVIVSGQHKIKNGSSVKL